jgi:hypothetical protein
MAIRAFHFLISNQPNLFEKRARRLLPPRNGSTAGGAGPILISGLYVVRSFVAEEQAYILYWPEDTTWSDQADSTVLHNRVMFMRYERPFHSRSSQIDRTRVDTSRNYAIR